ncbi:hypothetical protein EBT31_18155, partial [bacterium]|nr:hypothetical protein [bacterium]
LILPPNVEKIGKSAFSSCTNLRKITIPPKKKEPTIEEMANTPLTPPGLD